ncbi:hypothetical protein HPP05_24625 [Corallococcus exiguus]|uniref:hypothetical protein n=1 Tax=Corallococcus exiguus TaxID=83462 RepID=UPI001494E737|nr:hypothetical protein [Corallococcus exiguus]NPC72935.1 hypothetical protein [Corallococcus exiguus]
MPAEKSRPFIRGMADSTTTIYYASEGTPLPCGCSCLFARVLDVEGREIDRVSVAHPRDGILLRYVPVDGGLTTRDEHRAFELHCMRHPDTVVRSALPRGRTTVTNNEGREVGALHPVATSLDGLLYDEHAEPSRVQEGVGRLHLGWYGWDADGREAEAAQ